MELQLPIWVFLVALFVWAFAGYVWGRSHEHWRSRPRVSLDATTITVADASALRDGDVIVAVNPQTGGVSAPLTVAKIGGRKR